MSMMSQTVQADPQGCVIYLLRLHGVMSLDELRRVFPHNRSRNTLAGLLRRMAARGLVRRIKVGRRFVFRAVDSPGHRATLSA
jgi:hypothetical protein